LGATDVNGILPCAHAEYVLSLQVIVCGGDGFDCFEVDEFEEVDRKQSELFSLLLI
jgi:hypothetical protein